MRSVIAAVLVPILVVFLVGPYTFLPSLLEYAVARDVKARLGTEKQPDVELKSDPPLRMLAGEFSGGRIVMKNTDLGGVTAKKARIDLEPFDINVWTTIREGRVVGREPLSGDLRIDVPEAEVSRLVKADSEIPIRGVDVQDDGVVVHSEVSALGTRFPVSVEGEPGLARRKANLRAAGPYSGRGSGARCSRRQAASRCRLRVSPRPSALPDQDLRRRDRGRAVHTQREGT